VSQYRNVHLIDELLANEQHKLQFEEVIVVCTYTQKHN